MRDDDDDFEEKPRRKRQREDDDEDRPRGRNGIALAAYYCGVFAMIPLCFILAPLAVILGVVGIIKAQSLNGKGMGHSITGIVLGLIGAPIVWVLFYVVVVIILGVNLGKK